MSGEILSVRDLTVAFPRPAAEPFHAVDAVSVSLARGETLGIVGESGSGKTMLAMSMMNLVPHPGRIETGSVTLLGEPMTGVSEAQLNHRRGRDIGMVFQDPMTSLNPVRRIGSILTESVQRHSKLGRQAARRRALAALKDVGIPSPDARLKAYPHELSGGLRQRVMIALALINHPAVIIADEPTTALDATIQAQILALLRERLEKAALILITHDLGVAAELCDRIAVMYDGRIVETGRIADILARPAHPYTAGLLAAVPKFDFNRRKLVPIEGGPPAAGEPVTGCAFAARCSHRHAACQSAPELVNLNGRAVACWRPLAGGGPQ